MRVEEFKLSVVGMDLTRRLFMRSQGELLPLTTYEVEDNIIYLMSGEALETALRLDTILNFLDNQELIGIDTEMQFFPIYGYRVENDYLILG
ncbi:hypothetical protein JK159_05195 [Weissella minor]|uniref:hypothetical protein n=1 Tax=Weissella minor TaxID=1620 RepID=UPI001BB03B9E|nr:hypothetical protein [Weissella minor]MBS0949761.1 hypothetical protein [Weissella minor]